MLKDAASVLAGPLCHLYNISLRNVALPQEWKLADVIPIFKKGQMDDTKNYRPVSLNPIICKCLERLVCNQLLNFLKTKSEALDKKNNVDLIYLDISRALTQSHTQSFCIN